MRLINADALSAELKDGAEPNVAELILTLLALTVDAAPTIDPMHAAGGCYCRECCFGRKPNAADMQDGYVYCQQQSTYKEIDSFCSDGEPKEAQDV